MSLELLDSVSPIVYLVDSSADGTVYDGVLNNLALFEGKISVEYQVESQA
jgi:hypothetical protein